VQNGCGVQAIPRDTQGVYSLPLGTLVTTGDTLLVKQHNPAMQDLALGLSSSLSRTGNGGMLAPLSVGGFRVTNVAPAMLPSDAVTFAQLQDATGALPSNYVGGIDGADDGMSYTGGIDG